MVNPELLSKTPAVKVPEKTVAPPETCRTEKAPVAEELVTIASFASVETYPVWSTWISGVTAARTGQGRERNNNKPSFEERFKEWTGPYFFPLRNCFRRVRPWYLNREK